jgi:hypothetical protein
MRFLKYQIVTLLLACSWALPLHASSIITFEHNFSLTVGNLIPTSVSNYSHIYYLPGSNNPFPQNSNGNTGAGSAYAQYVLDADNLCISSSNLSSANISLITQFPVSQGGFNWLTYYLDIPGNNYIMNLSDNYSYHYILNGAGQYYSYAFIKIDGHFYYPWEYLNVSLQGNFDSGVISTIVNFSEILSAGSHTIQFYFGTTQEFVPLPSTLTFLSSGMVILILGRRKLLSTR